MDYVEQAREKYRDDFFADAVGLIEASDAEYHFLWEKWHHDDRGPQIPWEGRSEGFMPCVGTFGADRSCSQEGQREGFETWVSFRSALVKGKKVIFYHVTSRYVDHALVLDYLDKHMPDTARRGDGYLNNTDANNPHIVFHRIGEDEL